MSDCDTLSPHRWAELVAVKLEVESLDDDLLARLGALVAMETNSAIPSAHYVRTLHGSPLFVDIRDYVGRELFLYGAHEPEVGALLCRSLKVGDVFVDVGAHYGYFTDLAAWLVGPTGRVLAVEPAPGTLDYLRMNTRGALGVKILDRPAWKSDEAVSLREYGLWSAHLNSLVDLDWTRTDAPPPPVARTHALKGVALDTVILPAGLKPVLVKVDVEGAELEALQGLRGVLEQDRPLVVFEPSRRARADLIAWWDTLGYEVRGLTPDGQLAAPDGGVGVNLIASPRAEPPVRMPAGKRVAAKSGADRAT